MGLVMNLPVTQGHGHICCECLPTGTHRALILGISVHYIPLLCNLLFLNLGIYGLVQATGVGTVLIWDFCVAITRGGGTVVEARVILEATIAGLWPSYGPVQATAGAGTVFTGGPI